MFSKSLFQIPDKGLFVVPFVVLLLVSEWTQRSKRHGLEIAQIRSAVVRWSMYFVLVLIIFCFGADQQNFIYFQF